MIRLTRLNSRPFVLNAEQIKTIESTPDTLITLLSGDQILVKEPLEDVVRLAIEFGRSIRTFAADPPVGDTEGGAGEPAERKSAAGKVR